jgi:hypothetical protein
MTRTVWFPDDEHLTVCISDSHPTPEVGTEDKKQDLWYSANDYIDFKFTARLVASESQKLGLGSFLAVAHAGCGESFRLLARWAQHNDSTRGLERLCNRCHDLDRRMQRKECIKTVLKTQDSLRQLKEINEGAMCLILAQVCSKHSERARRFASSMGLADALAVSNSSFSTVRRFMGTHQYGPSRCTITYEVID